MAELIEMPFGMMTWVGTRNHVLEGYQGPHGKGQFWGGSGSVGATGKHSNIALWNNGSTLTFAQ